MSLGNIRASLVLMRYYLYSVLSTLYRVRRVCTHVLTVKQYGLAARLLLLWFRLWLECLDVCHGADIMQLIRNSMYHWCAYDAGNFKPPPINRVSFWRQSIVCLSRLRFDRLQLLWWSLWSFRADSMAAALSLWFYDHLVLSSFRCCFTTALSLWP